MTDSFDLLTGRPRVADSVTLALDPNDAQRLTESRNRLQRTERDLERADAALARARASSGSAAAVEAAEEAQERAFEAHQAAEADLAALKGSIVTFTVHLKAVGPQRIEELARENPPTDLQRKAARSKANGNPEADPDWNEETFVPALLAEAVELIEFSSDAADITGLSVSQAKALWASPWPQGDRLMVTQTAVMLNQVSSQVEDLGKG